MVHRVTFEFNRSPLGFSMISLEQQEAVACLQGL